MRSDHPLLRIGDVRAVVIEGRQRSDDAAHDRHRVRVTTEAAIEGRKLLMQHGVPADRVDERFEFILLRKLAVQKQIGNFHEGRLLGELVDRVAAMEEDALFAVDIGDRALAAAGRGKAGIVGEHPRLGVELADVDDVGPDCAFQHRIIEVSGRGFQGDGLSFIRSAPTFDPRMRARLSAFPSSASTSKIPGLVVRPVSAARSGCASFPSFTSLRLGNLADRLLQSVMVPFDAFECLVRMRE